MGHVFVFVVSVLSLLSGMFFLSLSSEMWKKDKVQSMFFAFVALVLYIGAGAIWILIQPK